MYCIMFLWLLYFSYICLLFSFIFFLCVLFCFFFFFFSSRRRHTRWNCDWSSDVCSSDLSGQWDARPPEARRRAILPSGPLPRGEHPVTRLFRLIALSLLGLAAVAPGAFAADPYPNRPIKWIVPYPPAGTTDVLARIIAQWLSEKLGQSVVVENRPGAGNNLGTEAALTAPPDGYTMLLVNPANGINATLYKNLNFNFIRDVAPVAGLVRTPNVMEVTPSLPV